jgi:hypothetical protein
MPERIKLTEKVLRDAEPVPGRDYQIFDTDVRGFAACIYRGGGPSRWITAMPGASAG